MLSNNLWLFNEYCKRVTMGQLENDLRNILLQELKHLKKYGVMHLGFRYFLPDGRSFGCPTIDKWYEHTRTEDFFKHLKFYLTQELIYLAKHKFCYVTRADDQESNQYLTWLKKLELNNSVGVYKFNPNRIDSFFFICETNSAKQRDDLINNMQWLERHINSLTRQINKLSQNIINYTQVDFILDKDICTEIFKNCSVNTKVSRNCVDVIVAGRQVQKIVKEIANRAQISKTVTPHILRHTFATLALQKNISLASVQKILGHDRLATTSIYLNFTDEHVVDEFVRKW